MSRRAPISISVQPQILLYGVILTTVCGLTYYNERRRDPEEIEAEISGKYRGDVREMQQKSELMAAKIRGQDVRLDDVMNKLVWNGKATMPAPSSASSGTGKRSEESSSDSLDDESSSDSWSDSESEPMEDDEASMSGEERKRRRRERRRRRRERRKRKAERLKKQQEQSEKALTAKEEQLKKSALAMVAFGAIATLAAATIGSSRRSS